MPTILKRRYFARPTLVLALLALALGTFRMMPSHPTLAADAGNNYPSDWQTATNIGWSEWGFANSCPPDDSNCMASKDVVNGVTYGYADMWGYALRNCTSWAAWAVHNRDGVDVPSRLGNASTWATYASADGIKVDTTPSTGAVAQWAGAVAQWNGASWNGKDGHVAWIETVNSSTSITIEEYNGQVDKYDNPTGVWSQQTLTEGSKSSPLPWPDNVIYFGTAKSSNNTVLAVKKLTQSDGTNEVFWAKSTDVFETWWRGGSGLNLANLIHISQGNIVDIDVALYPSGEHDLYTATTNWIYETWWYPGQALHTTAIINSPSNIRHIQKTIGPDGVTQQLYVLTDTGAYEYWWNSGSNGIQHDTIMTLANPVAMYKTLEPDGTQVLFVADQSYPYMLRWGGGLSSIQQTTFSYFSGITSISFSLDADGKNRLYVGQSSGQIWEASWYIGGPISYWPMTGGAPVVELQKWEDDSEQVLYEATAGGVFEYYWPTGSNTLNGDTIVGSLSNVHAFVRSTDPGGVQSVYTAFGTNIDESWWIPGGNGVHTGQIE